MTATGTTASSSASFKLNTDVPTVKLVSESPVANGATMTRAPVQNAMPNCKPISTCKSPMVATVTTRRGALRKRARTASTATPMAAPASNAMTTHANHGRP